MDQSLLLFVELASGYSSVRNLRKSSSIKTLLIHHSSEHFPFLELSNQYKNRTKFYGALTRILVAGDIEHQEEDFAQFGKLSSLVFSI
jgi:exportin-7